MRTTLELPDPLFTRLKARAALESSTLKKILCTLVEEGLDRHEHAELPPRRKAADLPQVHGHLLLKPVAGGFSAGVQLSNAALFELMDE